ncbi:PREDICTED: uncharacterized protein LOC108502696 [Lepidothrix coronata]|uniref:Uncharacterized protein LOC108502696 n=1 Tax=Lepidothrix coronata TaxID=321398 RepID=A0A6J0I3T5_9PASS|nr:PREDICTED: uncharacterized protein LOC108502696 [Lepidothrix coronata]
MLASAFFPVNPREFTPSGLIHPMMESGPRGQIKSFQCRTFGISVAPGSHHWQKCHDYNQSQAAHTEGAGEVVLTVAAEQMCQGHAISSHATASAVAKTGLPRSSSLQLKAGHCQGQQEPQPPERLGQGQRRRRRKASLQVTRPRACQSLGAPAALQRPGPAFPSEVPRTHDMAMAASPQARSPAPTHGTRLKTLDLKAVQDDKRSV